MDEKQYRLLCRVMDQILLASDTSPARIAIPWLHVVREHPVFLKNYESLLVSKTSFGNSMENWIRLLRYRLLLLRSLLKCIYSLGANDWLQRIRGLPSVDILFISHLLNDSQLNDREDFYYSDLPQKLTNDGHPALVAMLNHTGNSRIQFSGNPDSAELPRVVFPSILGLNKEIRNILLLWKESRRLKKSAKAESGVFKRKVIYRASQEALSPQSLSVIRLAIQIHALVSMVKPRIMILTHEGHAWERLAFAYARKAQPSIVCIGYLQAPLFRMQHAIKRSLASVYNPDKICTSGNVQRNLLKNVESLREIPVTVIGSRRSLGKSEKPLKFEKKSEKNKSHKNTCLVIPEGIVSEANILFDFSLCCWRKNPHVEFIWRLHPILSFDAIVAQNPKLKTLPDCITVSSEDLEEDLNRSQWALYRGSSAIIRAVVAGLRPLYLKIPYELNIDPLHELDGWRIQIETPDDFMRALGMGRNEKNEYDKALDYCLNIYTPFDYKMVKSVIGFAAY